MFCILNFVNLAAKNCIKGNDIFVVTKKKDIIYEDFSPESICDPSQKFPRYEFNHISTLKRSHKYLPVGPWQVITSSGCQGYGQIKTGWGLRSKLCGVVEGGIKYIT